MTDSERNDYILANSGLIRKCVIQCKLPSSEREDAMQDAFLQVLRVFNRFDSSKGSFSTFIWPEIKQYVYRKNSGMSDRTFKAASRISKAKENFEKCYFREPTLEELSREFHMTEVETKKVLLKIEREKTVNLDAKTDEENQDFYNLFSGGKEYEPENVALRNEEKSLISNALKNLSEKENKVLELRYNLGERNDNDFSLRETARKLSMSHEAVRVIEKKALKKLKVILEKEGFAA